MNRAAHSANAVSGTQQALSILIILFFLSACSELHPEPHTSVCSTTEPQGQPSLSFHALVLASQEEAGSMLCSGCVEPSSLNSVSLCFYFLPG